MQLLEICIKSLIKNYDLVGSLVGIPESHASLILKLARDRGISTKTHFLKIFLEFIEEKLIISLNNLEFQKYFSKSFYFAQEISSLDLTGVKSLNDDTIIHILGFGNLVSLNISFTFVSDLGFSHLLRPLPNSGLLKLIFLNISGTKISKSKLFKLLEFPNLLVVNVSYLLSKKEALTIFTKDLGWEFSRDPIRPLQSKLDLSKDFKAWILDLPLKDFKESDFKMKLDPSLAFRPRLVFRRV